MGVQVKMTWPLDADAHGAVDLLLAHAVVEPVLRKHAKEIYWWRFHRRALRDKLGHQFSFLFYADSNVALCTFKICMSISGKGLWPLSEACR